MLARSRQPTQRPDGRAVRRPGQAGTARRASTARTGAGPLSQTGRSAGQSLLAPHSAQEKVAQIAEAGGAVVVRRAAAEAALAAHAALAQAALEIVAAGHVGLADAAGGTRPSSATQSSGELAGDGLDAGVHFDRRVRLRVREQGTPGRASLPRGRGGVARARQHTRRGAGQEDCASFSAEVQHRGLEDLARRAAAPSPARTRRSGGPR